ncbi:transcription/translation regulatory transformer protein RfaH [Paraperlucidibaca wandonensis]|uniref:Transcription/translation regulatory transformer protein RfaH n=1 Tax=Paraperlucidibaca wandonensis TaxID=1268273 RepID=A0ABW3HFM6_9GAMM
MLDGLGSMLELDIEASRRWYVLQCKPRECERAVEQLANQGYQGFVPTIRREILRRGKRTVVVEPLFPHYIFVQLCTKHDNWAPIRSTRGVAKVLRFGELPLAVPDAIVDALQARETGQDAGSENPTALFAIGQDVLINEGPLAGLDAVVAARDGTERVVLLLKLLHQEQRVSMPIQSLKISD